jgi:L-iditol 2-dehydrogenase
MKTMKAAVLHAPNDLRVEDVPVPAPGPGEALVRVTACGVCGSDVPRVRTTGTYRFPTIPGHEMAGTVERIVPGGSAVPGIPVCAGDSVAVVPLIPCGACRFCAIGRHAQCERYDFLGSRSDGGFAQYLKAPIANLVPLPRGVGAEEGALLEPITVALHAVRNLGLAWGESVAVIGLGAIGAFVAQWAKVFGASSVFGLDISAEKVETARRIGITEAYRVDAGSAAAELERRTGGDGVDVVFEASGAPLSLDQAIACLRPFGRVGLLGRPASAVQIAAPSVERVLRRQLTIQGTWSFELAAFPSHPWAEAAEALARGALRAAPLVTHRVTLDELPAAIEMMASGKEHFHKVLVLP